MGKPIVATDADGLLDILQDGRDALVVPKARRRRRWPRGIVRADRAAGAGGAAGRRRARHRRALRHRRLRPQDGAALRAAARVVAARPGAQGILTADLAFLHEGGAAVSDGWSRRGRRRGGWARRRPRMLGVVLLGWALTVNYPKLSYGFFSDASTYYGLGHSLADDGDFEFRREDLVRVWREFPSGPEGIFLKRGADPDLRLDGAAPVRARRRAARRRPDPALLRQVVPLSAVRGAVHLAVRHQRLPGAARAGRAGHASCAPTRSWSRAASRSPALLFAAAFVFVSVAPVYLVWLTPDLFNLGLVTLGYFFWLYKEVAPPADAGGHGAIAVAGRAAHRSRSPRSGSAWRPSPSRRTCC